MEDILFASEQLLDGNCAENSGITAENRDNSKCWFSPVEGLIHHQAVSMLCKVVPS